MRAAVHIVCLVFIFAFLSEFHEYYFIFISLSIFLFPLTRMPHYRSPQSHALAPLAEGAVAGFGFAVLILVYNMSLWGVFRGWHFFIFTTLGSILGLLLAAVSSIQAERFSRCLNHCRLGRNHFVTLFAAALLVSILDILGIIPLHSLRPSGSYRITLGVSNPRLLAINFDGTLAATVDDAGLLLMSCTDKLSVQHLPLQKGLVTALAFSPSADVLAIGTLVGDVFIWKRGESVLKTKFKCHASPVTAIGWTRGGAIIVTATSDLGDSAETKLFDNSSLMNVGHVPGVGGNLIACTDDAIAVSSYHSDTIVLLNINELGDAMRLQNYYHQVRCLAISSDRRILACADGGWSGPARIVLWNLDNRARLQISMEQPHGLFNGLGFSGEAMLVSSNSSRRYLTEWRFIDGKISRRLAGLCFNVIVACVSNNGQVAIAMDESGNVVWWKL